MALFGTDENTADSGLGMTGVEQDWLDSDALVKVAPVLPDRGTGP